MTDRNMPDTAEDWAQFLIEKPLPSPFKVGKQVLHSLHNQNLPFAKIVRQINRDPVLSYRIMHDANHQRAATKPGSKTLDHAISMVGIEQLKQMIQSLPFQDSVSSDIKSFYYIRCLCTSLYAAHLGEAISQKKSRGNPEEIYWSSLFLGVPLWYLWRHATPEMRLVRYAIRSNFKLPEMAEREVLGESVFNISATLVKELDLPDLVSRCYDKEQLLTPRQWVQVSNLTDSKGIRHPIEDRSLSMAIQSPAFIVMLANLIAEYAIHDWYSRACLRSQRILANYLQIPLSEAVSLTHRVAASMSRSHPLPGVMLPAAKLFVDPRKRTRAKAAKEEPASTLRPENTEPKAATAPVTQTEQQDNSIFDELINIMDKQPEAFTDLHELMNAATQGLAYGIKLKRVMACLVNRNESRIKTYYHVGSEKNTEFSGFSTELIPGTIFAKLVERPASIWVKPHSDNKIARLIPMNFKQVIEVDEFFLMSVFVNKKPVAIFYADNYHDKALNEVQYNQFKAMCTAASKALKYQAKNKAGKASD